MTTEFEFQKKSEINYDHLNFIVNAITDSQSIIRAIDIKLKVILLFFFVPFSNPDNILFLFSKVGTNLDFTFKGISYFLLLAAFVLSWVLGIFVSFAGVSSQINPIEHINNDCNANGSFFLVDVFNGKFKFWHSLFCVKKVKGNDRPKISNIIDRLPDDPADQKKELAFELTKIVFIRDLKVYRQKIAIKSVQIWFSIGVLISSLIHLER